MTSPDTAALEALAHRDDRAEAIAAWSHRAGLAPLLDGKGEAELERDILDLVYDQLAGQDPNFRDRVSANITDALLPVISGRLAAARAEGAAQERERIAASYRASAGEMCAWGLPLPEEGPCQCGATDMEQCRWMSLDGEPIRARAEEPTDGK